MKTHRLIALLAEDAPVRMRHGRTMAAALFVGAAISIAYMVLFVGIRPDILAVVDTPRVCFKICQTLILAVVAAALVFPMGCPGVSLKTRALALVLPVALLAVGVTMELVVVPERNWMTSMTGNYAVYCILFVPILSLAPLACLLLALKEAAPDKPGLAGAVAGLAAGAIAASVYAWHCPDDSPLFLAVWYSIAIMVVIFAGFILGRHVLRW
ncbi:hypothetical protein ASC97_31285 [Rhizobium sp. Root1203]|uniref:NrsF family protein n=1 Tax=Rhizobium sp. Root1203 TaxID=1736427 RepID=UPI00070F4422|nr:DUF1109 domain-containing protein [Rhizobium sp. Root1203]KQV15649.1 hypothetical protein ASC97_31285 [Rhizobium sp. Root1203]